MAEITSGEGEHKSSYVDSAKEKITEMFDDSSSSDSDGKDKDKGKEKKSFPVPPKKDSRSWKEKPVHTLLGGGEAADIFLWRSKRKSAGILGFATIIWALFEMIEYHLLSLLCHVLILVSESIFCGRIRLTSSTVALDEDTVLQAALVLRLEIDNTLELLREIASGKDLKKFLAVIAGLWIVSVAGSWCSLLTLVYICFVLLHTMPLYEQHKDKADVCIEKAEGEIKKQFDVLQEKVLSRIPSRQSKDKKFA